MGGGVAFSPFSPVFPFQFRATGRIVPAIMGVEALSIEALHAGDILWMGAAAFLSALVSGMGGFGGSFILVLALSPIIGAKAVVPLIGVFALVSNIARLIAYRRDVAWRTAWLIFLASLPGVWLGANFLRGLSDQGAAILLGATLIAAVPVNRLLAWRGIALGTKGLIALGLVFGVMSGATVGSGMLAIAGLMSHGLAGAMLLGTDAALGLMSAVARLIAYQELHLLNANLVIAGLAMSAMTFPGTWIARWAVAKMGMATHRRIMEGLILGGGVFILVQALTGA